MILQHISYTKLKQSLRESNSYVIESVFQMLRSYDLKTNIVSRIFEHK